MTEFSYIPIIKTGDAELKALQNLDTRYKVKFTPVIELTRGRRSKKDVVGILQKRIDKPGVLLELGFLSNASDRYLLKQDSYQNKIATTIRNGVVEYLTN